MNLNLLFLNYCKKNNLEVNPNQINLIEELNRIKYSAIAKIVSKLIPPLNETITP